MRAIAFARLRSSVGFALCLCAWSALPAAADVLTSSVFAAGGGSSGSGAFTSQITIGQGDLVGTASGGSTLARFGFLHVPPPLDPGTDTDGDGLPDLVETGTGIYQGPGNTGSDPLNPDTDGDGLRDGDEVLLHPIVGRNPNTADNPTPSDLYKQDFDAYPDGFTQLGDSSVIGSSDWTTGAELDVAATEGGALRLTSAAIVQTGASFRIPALLNSSAGWTASFEVELADAAGGNPPADGFSFNYGAIPERTASSPTTIRDGLAEEGWAGISENLSFEVDTWRTGDLEQGFNIGAVTGGLVLPDAAFSNSAPLLDGQAVSGRVVIAFSPATGLTFLTTGLNTNAAFSDVPLPAGFSASDLFSFAISARTGGATEDLLIDNLCVLAGDPEGDRDGDLVSNLVEQLNGTDPTDPNDPGPNLRILTIARQDNEIILSFSSVPGESYTVDYSLSLAPASWNVLGNLQGAPAANVSHFETSLPGSPSPPTRAFFRVRTSN